MQNPLRISSRLLFAGFACALICSARSCFATGDKVTELEFTARTYSRSGDKTRSIDAMNQAIELATKLGRPKAVITRMRLKYINLLFETNGVDEAVTLLRGMLADKTLLLQDEKREPEIIIELDDAFNFLRKCGVTAPTIRVLETAEKMTTEFEQFNESTDPVLQAKFDWFVKHNRWLEAGTLAEKLQKTYKESDLRKKEWLAKAYVVACKNKDGKLMKTRYEQFCNGSWRHPNNTDGWCIDAATILCSAGAYEAAMPIANKACALQHPSSVPANGSFGVSESFITRARIELLTKHYREAERDARISLTGAIGEVKSEYSGNLGILIDCLRAQGKKKEADKYLQQLNNRPDLVEFLK